MSKDQKIIEHEGTKYYKEKGRWYRLVQIEEDSVPANIKNKTAKISFPQETQLDIFKCLNFNQLVSFQESSFYFKNIIDKYGKELAKKKFSKLEFRSVYEEKWEENKFIKVQVEHKFVEIEPHLYDFELSEQLKEKWEHGIDESIPMFITFDDYEDIDIVVCELQQNYNKESYYLQLPKFPKNMEEMAIARFVFQLLFNCAFEYFEISCIIINPQMIELLFDEATNMPLQIHSQRTEIFHDEADCLNFAWNHLISNHLGIDLCFGDEEIMGVLLFKILAKGGNKFLNVTYEYPDVELYFSIVEYIETSQDISKVVKEIKFETMVKFSIEKAAKNKNKLKIEEDGKTTKFQLFNKHNPKIEFSVTIKVKEENYEEIEEESESILENFDNLGIENDFGINVDAVIRRI